MKMRWFFCLAAILAFEARVCANGALKAGVAKVVITPAQDMWLAGYAARTAPSRGEVQELHAKALAFEDETGARSVMITTDLIGLPRAVVGRLVEIARSRFGVPRERLMVTFSHTHCGPVIGTDRLIDMYGLNEEQMGLVDAYTAALPERILDAVRLAIGQMEPCRVEWGVGKASFAVNRRQYTTNGVVGGVNPIGPVDHDVPVLKVSRPDGSVLAVVHGYACHNTTLQFYKFSGDYAGFSQAFLEAKLPGTVALFVAGCGADANPHPRSELRLAQQYGEELGEAVLAVMRQQMRDVTGPIEAKLEEIPLALSSPPSRAEIEKQLDSPSVYEQRRANRLLAVLDAQGKLPETYPYPVQVWRFGKELVIPVLAGEVVVDYSLRLKHEFGRDRTWVIAYASDFVAYIPSLRVLREGGYEGGGSMVYFGHHGPWTPAIEDDILRTVRKLGGGEPGRGQTAAR